MIDELNQDDCNKYKKIAELLSMHIFILNKISKDCESLEELQELINTLDSMKNKYFVSKKERDEMHFKIC